MNRRKFLQLCGALTLAGTSGSLVCAVDGMASSLNGSPLYSTTRLAMGTFVSITIADAPQSLAEEAAGRAFEKIARLSNVFNEFDATTPLAVLNDQGRLSHAPGELAACLRHCAACNQLTDGAFDPTIKPVLDAFRKQGEQVDMSHLPTDLIGFGLVRMDGTNVTLSRDGMGLTLNGAAKGFIADRAGEVMERCGVTNYLLDAGGDIPRARQQVRKIVCRSRHSLARGHHRPAPQGKASDRTAPEQPMSGHIGRVRGLFQYGKNPPSHHRSAHRRFAATYIGSQRTGGRPDPGRCPGDRRDGHGTAPIGTVLARGRGKGVAGGKKRDGAGVVKAEKPETKKVRCFAEGYPAIALHDPLLKKIRPDNIGVVRA